MIKVNFGVYQKEAQNQSIIEDPKTFILGLINVFIGFRYIYNFYVNICFMAINFNN
jgi:hypothetical protein